MESINELLRGNTRDAFLLGQSIEQVAGAAAGPESIPARRGGEDAGGEGADEVRVEEVGGGGEERESLGLEEGREGLEEDSARWDIGGGCGKRGRGR